MTSRAIKPRRRVYKVLRLFFSLVLSFLLQYVRARLAGRSYDFFEDSVHNRRRAVQLRTTALEMGGVLIKVGQFLSSRVDLLPTEYIEELALLQDEVPAVPFSDVRPVIEESLGDAISGLFAELEPEPIAAASLGQVHRAVLPTGEAVAVKVQRPHIDAIVAADLTALRYIVRWLDSHTPIGKRADLPLILREFEETLTLELDYRAEAHHAERIGTIFSGDPQIAVPRVYWSHSAGRVITLQFMQGIKVTDFKALEAAGIDRSETAEILMQAYLRQVLEVGFFHADPHPGNILVRPGPTVVFLDFGMVGDISPPMRDNIRKVFLGVVRRNYDDVVTALMKLGFVPASADRGLLKRALSWAVDTFYEMSFAELRSVNPQVVLDRLQEVFYTESVRIPANFAFLGRALGTLSGLCTALDPSFQFVTVAEPFARRLVGARRRDVVRQAVEEVRDIAISSYATLRLTQSVLAQVDSGELSVERHLSDISRSVTRLERAASRIIYGLLVTAFLTVGALIYRSHYTLFALGAFVVALIFLVNIFVSLRRSRRTF